MDDEGRVLARGWVLVEENVIIALRSAGDVSPLTTGQREATDADGVPRSAYRRA